MTQDAIKLRTIFMGTSEFAADILQALLDSGYNIVAVYTQPDKKVGRKQEVQKSAVKLLAEKNKLPIFQPERLNAEITTEIADQKPDLIVVAAYGRIIPKAVLEIPGFGALNIHASLLPKFRGPSPIQNAILCGETETGITIMLMDEGIDTGDILAQKKVAIGKTDTTSELTKKLAVAGSELLLKTIPRWIIREIKPKKQASETATLCQLIERADGRVLWSDSAEEIYNRFRAFQPWPGIFTHWESGDSIRRIKLNRIDFMKNNPEAKHHIGEVFQLGEKIGVQTMLGVVILEEVQMEGKGNVTIEEFANGYRDFVGSVLK